MNVRQILKWSLYRVVALAVAGCAANGSTLQDAHPANDEVTALYVQNDSWQEMRIYALTNGQRYPLGTIASTAKARLAIPVVILGGNRALRFMADPIGSRAVYTSQELYIPRGTSAEWIVRNNIRLSSLYLR